LDYPNGPNIIPKVLVRGRQEREMGYWKQRSE